MTAPEFSRPERADAIGEGEHAVHIVATDAERIALARRFDVKAIDRLEGDFRLRRDAGGVIVLGRVRAAVVQACVVTDEPVPLLVDEAVALRFVIASEEALDEIELDEGALDTIAYDGAAIDLGEVAAETMALALDPYPRAPGAVDMLRKFGVISEEEAKPLGALAGLKAKLEGN